MRADKSTKQLLSTELILLHNHYVRKAFKIAITCCMRSFLFVFQTAMFCRRTATSPLFEYILSCLGCRNRSGSIPYDNRNVLLIFRAKCRIDSFLMCLGSWSIDWRMTCKFVWSTRNTCSDCFTLWSNKALQTKWLIMILRVGYFSLIKFTSEINSVCT